MPSFSSQSGYIKLAAMAAVNFFSYSSFVCGSSTVSTKSLYFCIQRKQSDCWTPYDFAILLKAGTKLKLVLECLATFSPHQCMYCGHNSVFAYAL